MFCGDLEVEYHEWISININMKIVKTLMKELAKSFISPI